MNSLVLAVTPLVSLWFCAVCVFITYHPLSAPCRSSVAKGDRFRAILLRWFKKTMGWNTTTEPRLLRTRCPGAASAAARPAESAEKSVIRHPGSAFDLGLLLVGEGWG